MLDVSESTKVQEAWTAKPRGTKPKNTRKAAGPEKKSKNKGLKVNTYLSSSGTSPFDELDWERRQASISDDKGNAIFAQNEVEVPKNWSMLATNVVSSKYFYGGVDTKERETSVRDLIHRVTRTIADWGLKDGYFANNENAENFYNELSWICVNQYGAFNSPVWFNVGLHNVCGHSAKARVCYSWDTARKKVVLRNDSLKYPQASACFIQSVEDDMEGIMRLATSEALLFKYGSGTGTDLSTLRSKKETLSGGGVPSGPVSFMRIYDQVAGAIKSGGKTRRAAKMQSLKIEHPDIIEFINCKVVEEKKAWALIEQGYDGSFGGDAYESVMFQNANLSVRVTDDFMKAVEDDATWQTHSVTSGEAVETHKARDIMKKIAENTHICGDPGLQYASTINNWHTCSKTAPINASNPCSEYMFVDDSACNLASINLMKFVDNSGKFDVERFKHVVRMFIIAQDILVDNASYPTPMIGENSHRFRPLGLGYANLGALIMRQGMPYDSDEGRGFAASITSLLTGQSYVTSQELAKNFKPFDGYAENKESMNDVMKMHRSAVDDIDSVTSPRAIRKAAKECWDKVVSNTTKNGFRNAQVTVLAPTGTIGFMMDCDTTGVEPDIALVKYKQLSGGGMMKIVNRTLPPALSRLGYTADEIDSITKHVDENDTIEGASDLKQEHLHVFDCAFKPRKGKRYISYKAHLKMMAAVQPFLSGAISKTVNMPADATVNEIMQAYMDGWHMGLKAIAVYRDGSKRTQPLNTSATGSTGVIADSGPDKAETEAMMNKAMQTPFRRKMPVTRNSLTHKFEVAGHEGYLTVGKYEDGSPGELFITMAKEGSTVGGTMDAFGTAISLCLQYGVPIKELCKKFAHSRFEPSGFTKNSDIPIAKSLVDYIFRWLSLSFPDGNTETQNIHHVQELQPTKDAPTAPPQPQKSEETVDTAPVVEESDKDPDRVDTQFGHFMEDAPACDTCGSITVRNGSCYRCYNCGNSMGCS